MTEQNKIRKRGGTPQARSHSSVFFNLLALAVLLSVIIVLHHVLTNQNTTEKIANKQETKQEILEVAKTDMGTQESAVETEQDITKQEDLQAKEVPLDEETIAEVEIEKVEKKENPEVEIEKVEKVEPPKVAEVKASTRSDKAIKDNIEMGKTVKARNTVSTKGEPSVADLDNDSARIKYLKKNYELSTGLKALDKELAKESVAKMETDVAQEKVTDQSYHKNTPTYVFVEDLDSEHARTQYLKENKKLSSK